jgi:hypothetical protein
MPRNSNGHTGAKGAPAQLVAVANHRAEMELFGGRFSPLNDWLHRILRSSPEKGTTKEKFFFFSALFLQFRMFFSFGKK